MQDFIQRAIGNLTDFFSRLDNNRKVGVVVTSAFILAGMVGIIMWAAQTRYATLYTDLNKEDSKKISLLLEEKKVSYQVGDNGKTIKIQKDMVDQWRLHLATLGVNFSGTLGYEVLDKQTFGTTSFVQKINRKRALEGELVRTIMYIRGINRARVHLSIPESSPFVVEKKAPSASVVVELARGVSLTPQEIKGIGSLVSAAIEGMRQENVVILNARGKKLSENIGDRMTEYTANRMALELKISRQYEEKIEAILSKIVGAGKVVAKVAVVMDFTESVSTKTQFDAENPAIVSEVKNIQNLDGRRPSAQGIPGSRSNLPGKIPQRGIAATSNTVSKELTTRNYSIPSIVTKEKRPTAGISKISAAVMIDGRRVAQVDQAGKPIMKDGKQVMVYEAWSQSDLANFSAIVGSTLGLVKKRGDDLTIKSMEFIKEDVEAAHILFRERANRELVKNIIKYLAIGLAITLFFFFVVKPFIQWVTDNTVESIEDFLPRTLEELEKVQKAQKLPGLEDALPQIEEKINPQKIEGNLLREKIVSEIETNPAKAAQVIHEMIHVIESDKAIA
ncbi:MAG: flagellar M-ring protein FliF [Epsilonproteobacteria bacterium]|nr:MAG: flagellar M-ring protein FliF [Campylobacterota bacterium]RLA66134.1 MAG: flagellar M-ring protein FliF [Campylobacterota bacterium]